MTWTPPTNSILSPLNPVVPDRVFYEWDRIPLSFTSIDKSGSIGFVHLMSPIECTEGHREQCLAVPITPEWVDLLAANRLPILDASQSDDASVLNVDMANWRIIQAWPTRTAGVPIAYLLEPAVMLLPKWERFETPKPWDRMGVTAREKRKTQ